MKEAFVARSESVPHQLKSALHDIEQAVGWGWKGCHVYMCAVYPEVARELASNGYDVTVVKRGSSPSDGYTEVS